MPPILSDGSQYFPHGVLVIAGFRPGERATFVSAKVAKTKLAVAWPFGCPHGSPTPAARKLAVLKQCSPLIRCRLHGSARPPGQDILLSSELLR